MKHVTTDQMCDVAARRRSIVVPQSIFAQGTTRSQRNAMGFVVGPVMMLTVGGTISFLQTFPTCFGGRNFATNKMNITITFFLLHCIFTSIVRKFRRGHADLTEPIFPDTQTLKIPLIISQNQ